MTDNEETPIQITDEETTDIEETATVEKTKKSYVMTEARKKALEKGREARAKKVADRKAIKNEEKELTKLAKQRQKAMATLGISEDEYTTAFKTYGVVEEGSDEEEVVVKKKKAKPKAKPKKKIVYESESEEEEVEESSDDEPPTVERRRRNTYAPNALQEPAPKPFRLKRV
tara:strand:+ start:688 stop:1203 length:516 start_codon:yes stop_codon:yes gene_type:complete